MNWQGYCKAIGQGSSGDAVRARICTRIGGETPSGTLRKTEADMVNGRIDQDEYNARIMAIEDIRDMWKAGTQTFHVPTDFGGGWRDLGHGCHMRQGLIHSRD